MPPLSSARKQRATVSRAGCPVLPRSQRAIGCWFAEVESARDGCAHDPTARGSERHRRSRTQEEGEKARLVRVAAGPPRRRDLADVQRGDAVQPEETSSPSHKKRSPQDCQDQGGRGAVLGAHRVLRLVGLLVWGVPRSRPLHIQQPGLWHRVMNRGMERRAISIDDDDAEASFTLVAEAGERWKVRCHAACLTSSHYRLLLRDESGYLGRAMRHIDGVFTQFLQPAPQSGRAAAAGTLPLPGRGGT